MCFNVLKGIACDRDDNQNASPTIYNVLFRTVQIVQTAHCAIYLEGARSPPVMNLLQKAFNTKIVTVFLLVNGDVEFNLGFKEYAIWGFGQGI